MEEKECIKKTKLSEYLLKQIRELEMTETHTIAEQLMKSGRIYALKEVYKEFFL